ncbi:MAG: hypothetical protein U0Q12_03930 [Vicinamibacterales bacterium]
MSTPVERPPRLQRVPRRRSIVRYAWASPNTCLGLCGVALALGSGGAARRTDGILEAWGGVLTPLLARWPLVPGGVAAVALGHVVLGADRATLDRLRAHELVHVRQAERYGPVFLPLYLLASLVAHARGGDPYYDNVFEREAYAEESAVQFGPRHGGGSDARRP